MKPLAEYSHEEIKAAVAERYGLVATAPSQKQNFPVGRPFAESVGYDATLLRNELPNEARCEITDWFRCIDGALVQQEYLARMELNGLAHPRVLWLGRNARMGHELSLSAVIRAEKHA